VESVELKMPVGIATAIPQYPGHRKCRGSEQET